MTVRPILNMVNHETNELFFDNLEIPAENLIGEEGQGLQIHPRWAECRAHADRGGMHRRRLLVRRQGDRSMRTNASCSVGRSGRTRACSFRSREAFINVEAASLMRFEACAPFDAQQPCGAEANMAKLLAADASWEAANACLQFHGGFGFACEYDVERKFRETRLYQVAPISTNLILSYVAEHVLGLPRSF